MHRNHIILAQIFLVLLVSMLNKCSTLELKQYLKNLQINRSQILIWSQKLIM